MATGKVARRTAVSDVAELLDSPEIAALIAELDALRWTGRKGFGARALAPGGFAVEPGDVQFVVGT